MSQTMYWEDYDESWEHITPRRTITEYDIMSFVTLCGFNEDLFLDEEYVKASGFGARIAPGALVFCYAEGLVIQNGFLAGSAMAYLHGEMDLKAPTYVGDTIQVKIRLASKRETRKPDRGIVITDHEVINQRGELVMTYSPTRMIKRRT